MALLIYKHPRPAFSAADYSFISIDLFSHVFCANSTAFEALKDPKAFRMWVSIKPYKFGIG